MHETRLHKPASLDTLEEHTFDIIFSRSLKLKKFSLTGKVNKDLTATTLVKPLPTERPAKDETRETTSALL